MPIADLLSQITGEPSPTHSTTPILPKRKADDDLRRPLDKAQRTGPPRQNGTRTVTQISCPQAGQLSASKTIPRSNGNAVSQNGVSSPVKNGHLNIAVPRTSSNPPKKGSYAEIMARGKAAQAQLGQVGKIQHKPIQKPPSKRELEYVKAQKSKTLQKALGPDSKFYSTGQVSLKGGRNGVKEKGDKAGNAPVPEKKIKKAALATTGYSGTARPKTGASKGSSRTSGSRSLSGANRDRNGRGFGSSAQYGYASEDEDEEEEEEANDYDSDVSSDMEAAVFEVDEEEEMAAKIARREDAEALAEENRLKREKEEKKRRLAAMAAKARRK